MNELDEFFSSHDFTASEPLSNCCHAQALGELFRDFGRCSDCLEMAEFIK